MSFVGLQLLKSGGVPRLIAFLREGVVELVPTEADLQHEAGYFTNDWQKVDPFAEPVAADNQKMEFGTVAFHDTFDEKRVDALKSGARLDADKLNEAVMIAKMDAASNLSAVIAGKK